MGLTTEETKYDKAKRHYASEMRVLENSLELSDERILNWGDKQELISLGRDCDQALAQLRRVDANLAQLEHDIRGALDASAGP